eukprot:350441-Chlamydomonas_euryale.AAC.1
MSAARVCSCRSCFQTCRRARATACTPGAAGWAAGVGGARSERAAVENEVERVVANAGGGAAGRRIGVVGVGGPELLYARGVQLRRAHLARDRRCSAGIARCEDDRRGGAPQLGAADLEKGGRGEGNGERVGCQKVGANQERARKRARACG